MARLPPQPLGVPPGSSYWNDWYEKLRLFVDTSTASIPFSNITATPTTVAGYGITDVYDKTASDARYEQTTHKNNVGGYAGLNAATRITVGADVGGDDIIVDSITKGIVLKSANGHYWRSTISNAGVLTWTDLGTTKP